ncbi:alpha/beta fold hydrolase [Gordonia zhaorongruii]|uniref:alpha/beta fold hydrolase n=1 Tax=Gordonia zhaorongruii TaxID=2597659 RepID=UPI001045ACB4|nr:alpha/beta fold hydrolase [Gordonia zhaorongruii]
MAKGTARTVGKWALIAGATAAGVVGAELGTIAGYLLREAMRFPKPVQDGPDPLLKAPRKALRSGVVGASDGTLLHVATSGDLESADEILVFIHGWTCNTSFWNPQFNHFTGHRAMVAYDQRGHGLSEMGLVRPSVETLGQDLQAVLEETIPEGKRAVLIGHSMGGMTIMSWAAQFGAGMEEKISGIVLASTAARGVVERQKLVPENIPVFVSPFEPLMETAFVSLPVPLPSTPFAAMLTHYIALGPVARQAHIDFSDDQISACSPKSRAAWGAAMARLDVLDGLEKITVPTAVVVGTEDRLTGVDHADEISGVLARNDVLHSYTKYPGAGHMVPVERGAAFNRLLDDVVGDLSEALSS